MKNMSKKIRKFEGGGTRDEADSKIDYEGFLSPIVLEAFGRYMHKHRLMPNGEIRASDNWQNLFGSDHESVCIKSLLRHVMDLWLFHRKHKGRDTLDDALAGIIFNAMAYWYKLLTK